MKIRWFQIWRCLAANVLYRLADPETKRKINADMDRYCAHLSFAQKQENRIRLLDMLLLSKHKTFRSVFYYRCKSRKALCTFSKLFIPGIREIEIYGDIEQGLLLSHNYMVVHPHKAGQNLRVDAGVVIGTNNGQFPTLGDNVTVGANATVIGGITVGSNVTIEPGSVVTKNLEGDAVYGGNPAILLRKADAADR